jgi:hypothetical protein
MHRFVILHHQSPTDEHWDVMLETDAALTTWSVPPLLSIGSSFACPATRLPDHRKHYLDYEGEITGNRGTVARIDTGTYEQLSPEMYVLHGANFSGTLAVVDGKMVFESNGIVKSSNPSPTIGCEVRFA